LTGDDPNVDVVFPAQWNVSVSLKAQGVKDQDHVFLNFLKPVNKSSLARRVILRFTTSRFQPRIRKESWSLMSLPPRQGLYDPQFEKDACGLGFVATLRHEPTHAVVMQALEILRNLTHRGAAGCDPCTGDGAGILFQIPHLLYQEEIAKSRRTFMLPAPGDYGVAMCFFPRTPAIRRQYEATLEAAVLHHGQKVLGWRDVPIETAGIGTVGRESCPSMRQLFIGRNCSPENFERTLFMIRKRAGRQANADDFYIASCSSKTVVYKGLLLAEQVGAFFPDVSDERTVSRLAMVHSRFSTNTFPTWERAQPFRLVCHNGEINTLRGNILWMRAREALLAGDFWGENLEDFKPIIREKGSDSAMFDNVVDFLVASGRSLPHVMMMLVPEAWEHDPDMSDEDKAFYEYHGCLVEPWDGPAALCFTDGKWIGGTLDRNGLRPAKYVATNDGLVVLASEFGVLDIAPERVVAKGRLRPGTMFLVDTEQGRIIADEEIKAKVTKAQPYRAWLDENKIDLKRFPRVKAITSLDNQQLLRFQHAFDFTQEDIRMSLIPMAETGAEPIGSMGMDAALPFLSEKPQRLTRYFKQHFAQVTNPPIDPIREEIVMSLVTFIGPQGNLLEETPRQCRLVELEHPILTNEDLATLRKNQLPDFRTATLSIRFPIKGPDVGESLHLALKDLCSKATRAIREGASILILSDRNVDEEHAAIPCLLALSAVHHHLIREGLRAQTGLLVESAEPREVADFCLLVGYGAGGVNPYLALQTIEQLVREKAFDEYKPTEVRIEKYIKAIRKGILKVMSKMGISTFSSYQGGQIFEAIGIDQVVIDAYFTGTASRLRGLGLTEIAEEAIARHQRGFASQLTDPMLDVGGYHHYRVGGERHLWTPESVSSLQKAVRLNDAESYEQYSRLINDQTGRPCTLRGLWELEPAGPPLQIEEVEPATEIVKRFATGAMSFGSISAEAHENLAIAMNRIGGKSNTGEGGEDPARFVKDANGDSRRSAIKQVASGRFGVTAHYLVNADELQIKMAQGAKPGEGGQLPGHKVNQIIARVRHSTPGVTLISPPPHHDIYSIEDLAQLIFDLKNINSRARVSVKLVAEAGVGTIAAGVAKAYADVILISGHDGGTGASPLTSIQHAGLPWELGLAETQQVLVMNGLRGRVRLQVDGQLKTGRDVVFGALLGAEEFGFATAPLVASGCIMMRKCHLNTCPVGVATQDPELRKKFTGQPEHVINYMFFVAEEVRNLMAKLGFRTMDEMIGRCDLIVPRRNVYHNKVKGIDSAEVLYRPMEAETQATRCMEGQQINLQTVIDHELISKVNVALERNEQFRCEVRIRNSDRAFGTMLSGELSRKFGDEGLPDDTIHIKAIGSAGQSFGAFAIRGTTLILEGDANDYVGKGLSGGVIVVYPSHKATFSAEEQVIVGNTVLYGATSGRALFNGRAGERFAVRNSGATTVVEGVGDHGCEYMTGGIVVVLGSTGRNFGAGMSGGSAYVFDEDGQFRARCHPDIRGDVEGVTEEDGSILKGLLQEHASRTKSAKAQRMLDSWSINVKRFVKVLPREYQMALQRQEKAPTSLSFLRVTPPDPNPHPEPLKPSVTAKEVIHG
jgi:glutamate synthase (NADPH) large chain